MKLHKTLQIITLCLALGLFFVAGCTPQESQVEETQTEEKLQIVATIGMISDVVQNIAGEHADVAHLMGPGTDPHLYKASEGDVRRLSNADIIFYNGLHLEAQMGEVLEQMGESKAVVAVGETVPEERLLKPADYEGLYDPHIWFDVPLWSETIDAILDTLIEQDPANSASYEANAAAYREKVLDLHDYVEAEIEKVPEGQRVLVTAHDAFNYFGDTYGFEVKGLQGISTEAEAGTRDVQDLADFITERKIKAIFVESSISERNVQAVQEAVQSRGWNVEIGGELFSDAMGDAGTVEGTYLGMVEHNVDTIVGALQ